MIKCINNLKKGFGKCIKDIKKGFGKYIKDIKKNIKKILFGILKYIIIPSMFAGILLFLIKKNIDNGMLPGPYYYFLFIFNFVIIFLLIFLITILMKLKKTKISKLLITMPFILLYLFFIISLLLGSIYGNLEFFINDFVSLINPYIMTYGFILYGGLLGYYITDKKENINIILGIMLLYLFVLIGLHFFHLNINNSLEQNYVEEEVYNNCLKENIEYIKENPIGFVDNSNFDLIKEYIKIPLKEFQEKYMITYIPPIYYRMGIECIDSNSIKGERISGIISISISKKKYINKKILYGRLKENIKKYYISEKNKSLNQ